MTEVGSAGWKLRWAASTGTRLSGVLTTVARSGQQQRYWGGSVRAGRAMTELPASAVTYDEHPDLGDASSQTVGDA